MAIRVSYKDKSTYSGVFLKSFIWSIFLNIFFFMNTWRMQYGDSEKNKLKRKGSLLGCTILPLLLLLSVPVRIISTETMIAVILICTIAILLTLVFIYTIKQYNKIKNKNKGD